MDTVVSNVETNTFFIQYALNNHIGIKPLPFVGMDKSGSGICNFYRIGQCAKGVLCPYRHIRGDKSVVCKHWLRGLCKKGDNCEFLHEYDMSKMPDCYFFTKFGMCSNKECPFLHVDPDKKSKDCLWYDRGFCRHGNFCKNRHIRRVMCDCYVCGFCPHGPKCSRMHPVFDLPTTNTAQPTKKRIVCHLCKETGHKAMQCPNQDIYNKDDAVIIKENESRPLNEVTCYKCLEQGHYANKCPKGPLAFLSSQKLKNSEEILAKL
ncbi:mRNA 3'-end-processing protein YTH1 [Intoshia linei]|uniref:Cleavage and polyadenylation specificity factor subunit 4 n=1 Tax=Intoshia linei TaxID=1819745 RepID=A0A177AY81_9BILA|nr:mRNA 3'-end-processing protein YTH1 [Intoshia linei]